MNSQPVTLMQLARLREESVRANKAYDAARKQWKAQQKAKARAQGLANARAAHSLPAMLAG